VNRNIPKGQAPILQNIVAQASLIKAGAALLDEEIRSKIEDRRRFAASIKVLEHNGDCLVRSNALLLARDFSGLFDHPFEPKNLRTLTSRLDDILDAIEEAAFQLSAYPCTWLIAGIPQSCARLKECTEWIHTAIEALAHGKALDLESPEISAVLQVTHDLLRQSIGSVYSRETDPLMVFTNGEICKTLLHAISSCKSAAFEVNSLEASRV
jgi:uncharacterized protein Yka (UPF0111/DUF47 family)